MNKRPKPKQGILAIDKYVPGMAQTAGRGQIYKLSSNESPLGTSPKAIEAFKQVAGNLSAYPDADCFLLRQTLAKKHNIKAQNIVIGAGSDELLHLLAQIYLGENDEAIMSEYGFLVYPIVTKGAGAKIIKARAKNYRIDIDEILALVSEKTKIIFLDNPNNPTGTYLNRQELERLHNALPKDILLVIDSAYAEYVSANDYSAGIELVENSENVVMVRTFSKIGLAALRLGWLYASEHIVDALNRLRGPFNVNMAAQSAGIGALEDEEFTKNLIAHNEKWRNWLSKQLDGNKLKVLPSQANFVLVLFPNENELSAQRANEELKNNGVLVRAMNAYGLPNALRISIGTKEAMEKVAKVLNKFIGSENV